MRGFYLNKPTDRGGCRGGVCSSGVSGNYYELEIGQRCNASPEMVAYCVLYDEIHELLRLVDSPLAKMVLAKHRDLVREIGGR